MAEQAAIDLEQYLQPIPGAEPAGKKLPFDIELKLKDFRTEIDPERFSPDDPQRPPQKKEANWTAVEEIALSTLSDISKDLILASRVTEAWTKMPSKGFTGLRDGLRLVRRMLEECWDRCYPDISDGDLTMRNTPLNWLGDMVKDVYFPETVMQVPIFTGPDGAVSCREWKNGFKTSGGNDGFARLLTTLKPAQVRERIELLTACQDEILAIDAVLKSKMDGKKHKPATLSGLKQSLNDCMTLAKMVQEKVGPEKAAVVEATPDVAGNNSATGTLVVSAPMRRAAVYQQIREAADALAEIEPHSPIPYLLKRAVDLGDMKFPDLMKSLLRDESSALLKMTRELGIPDTNT